MAFRYIIEATAQNGIAETAEKFFEKREIVLGRGTSSDLLLSGRLVTLKHARLLVEEERLVLEDLGSLSGVIVNGAIIKRQVLNAGDRVKIGDVLFEVLRDSRGWAFCERRRGKKGEAEAEAELEDKVTRLKLSFYLPSYTVLSSVFVGAVLLVYFVLPLLGVNRRSWDSGPISSAHKMIENQCSTCHARPFTQVQDAQCLACHSMSEHAPNMSAVYEKHSALNLRCAQCHMEHNGDEKYSGRGIIAQESALCVNCHGKLGEIQPGSDSASISSFAAHPEFRVRTRVSGSKEEFVRVSLAAKEGLIDGTPIKLNHELHLKPGISGPEGRETLQCSSCHAASEDLKQIKPIEFEAHCQRCHSLEFDPRFPGVSVPHAESDIVYSFLYSRYAQEALAGKAEELVREGAQYRQKPGGAISREDELSFTKSAVETAARSTEETLFNRTACYLCHEVKTAAENLAAGLTSGKQDENSAGNSFSPSEKNQLAGTSAKSNFAVVPPLIQKSWMPAAVFDHGAHQEVSCESCHRVEREGKQVRESKETKDVLLPGIDNCRQCHGGGKHRGLVFSAGAWGGLKGTGLVSSECITCHSFHEPLVLEEDTKRAIEKILLSFGELFPVRQSVKAIKREEIGSG